MDRFIRFIFCVFGLLLSAYALYVEHIKLNNMEYEALCDVNSYISCSVVFTSKYGKGFGIVEQIFGKDHYLNQPNSVFGIIFYVLQMAGVIVNNPTVIEVLYWTSFGSIFMCIYLAYILAFILHDFCVVCVGTYVVSIALYILNYRARKRLSRPSKNKSKKFN